MQSPWLTIWLVLSAIALVQSLLLALQAWEHRRFARTRLYVDREFGPLGRVALFAPCKGLDLELADNLRPLLEQDYPDYEINFIVESLDDPAASTIETLLAAYPQVAGRLLVAGRATDAGQKVHNLRQATNDLSPEIEILAFVDSDARPDRQWLRKLVQRLDRSSCGAVTGYRWFIPRLNTLANWLLHGINGVVTSLISSGVQRLMWSGIWGGSWALRREVFDRLEMCAAWHGKLCEDLVATRVLQEAGLRIEFEPNCMLASPVDITGGQMLDFLRRQYFLGRLYATPLWFVGIVGSAVSILSFWGGLLACIVGLATGASWTGLVASICAAQYGVHLLSGWLRRGIGDLYFPELSRETAAVGWFNVLAGPLFSVVNALGLFLSIAGRQMTWRGIRYEVNSDGQVVRTIRGRNDEERTRSLLHAGNCRLTGRQTVRVDQASQPSTSEQTVSQLGR